MNNYEWLKSQDNLKALGHKLCSMMDDVEINGERSCSACPMNNICEAKTGKNGFIVWLESEVRE